VLFNPTIATVHVTGQVGGHARDLTVDIN